MTTPPPSRAPNWPRALALLDDALALPAEQRPPWLEQAARSEPELAPLLHKLLAAHARVVTHELLATLPKVQRNLQAADAGQAGLQVGPFELIEPLGRGGMGSVWRARYADGRLKRDVAVKLPAVTDDPATLATLRERFARERDFLAQLQHPHIARLYDAGVSEQGQPYLAMEYVAGQPIDVHCDEQRLGVRQRLQLFLQVLDAVGHAHQQLVLHRDLKPGNVLVDARHQVHLLDFGVARLLPPTDDAPSAADEPLRTDLTERAGAAYTLGYAAPEQIARGALSTATDVYALGVMLYRLLTGQSPYQPARDTRGSLEDAVLTAVPVPPSARSCTAEALLARGTNAAGLKRALAPDLDAIVGKALKKNPAERYPTTTALADDLRRHLAQLPISARADSRLYRLRLFVLRHQVAVSLSCVAAVLLLASTGVAVWKAQVARVNEALAAKAAAESSQVQQWFVKRLGGANPEKNLNITDDDRRFADQALADAQTEFANAPGTLALILKELGRIYKGQGNPAKLLEVQKKRAALLAALPATSVDELVDAQLDLGQALGDGDEQDQARSLPTLKSALDLAMARAASDAVRVRALSRLADGHYMAAQHQEAHRYATQAAALAARVLPDPHPDLAEAHNALGVTSMQVGRFPDAIDALHKAIAIDDSGRGRGRVDRLNTHINLAQAEYAAGRYADSRRESLAVLAYAKAHLGGMEGTLVPARVRAVWATERMGRADEAAALADELLAEDLRSGDAFNVAWVRYTRGLVRMAQGQLPQAAAEFAAAEPGFAADARWRRQLAINQAALQLRSGQPAAALSMLEQVVADLTKAGGTDTESYSQAAERLGVAAARTGRLQQAREAFEQGCMRRRRLLPAEHPDRTRCESYVLLAAASPGRGERQAVLDQRLQAFVRSRDDQTPLIESMRQAVKWLAAPGADASVPADFPLLN